MPDQRLAFILTARDLASKEFAKARREVIGLDKDARKAGGGIGGLGSALTGMISPTALVVGGIGALAGGLFAAGKAAASEEQNIARLTTSLRENAVGWDGNVAAVEDVIRERERLAFSDDELRGSLATLISTTKDVTKALDLQRVAMDLARLRNIDLGTASDLVGKVYAGNVGILARYGIQLKRGTTATQALAEIQRRAAGQAETYAETTTGAWESTRIVFEDVVEDIGKELLPILKDLALFVRDEVVPAIKGMVQGVKDAKPVFDFLGDAVGALLDPMHVLENRFRREAKAAAEAERATKEANLAFRTGERAAGDLSEATGDLGEAAEDLAEEEEDLEYWFGRVTRAASEQDDALSDLSGEIFGTEILTGDLAQAQKDLAEALAEGPETEKAQDVAIWRGQIASARKDVFDLQAQLAQEAGPQAFYDWLVLQEQALGDADVALLEYIRNLKWLAMIQGGGITAEQPAPLVPRSGALQPFAHGGPYPGGEPILVGEHGPEILVPRGPGEIIPNAMTGGNGGSSAGWGGAPVVLQLMLPDGRVLADLVDEHLYYRRAAAGAR